MNTQIEDAIHSKGAILIHLSPYCPQFNPIELGFSLVKRWLQRYANLAYHHLPKEMLELAFKAYSNTDAIDMYSHCGYTAEGLTQQL